MVVTIHDVAKLAGVIIGTVSRVLNDSKAVKETTRRRIKEAIKQLNYKPDPIARMMGKKRRSRTPDEIRHRNIK